MRKTLMAAPPYPTTAQQLLAYKHADKRHFGLIARIEEAGGTHTVTVAPDDPIITANRHYADKVYQQSGVRLPSRREITDGTYILPPDTYLLGVSALLRISHDGDTLFPLMQRDVSAPSNPLCWSGYGGICSGHPADVMEEELAEELGIIGFREDKETFHIACPVARRHEGNEDHIHAIHQLKQRQLPCIRQYMPTQYHKATFTYMTMVCAPLQLKEMPPLHLHLCGQTVPLPCVVALDTTYQSATLCGVYQTTLDSTYDYTLVDPEPMQRVVDFFTEDMIDSIRMTPSLKMIWKYRNYISR